MRSNSSSPLSCPTARGTCQIHKDPKASKATGNAARPHPAHAYYEWFLDLIFKFLKNLKIPCHNGFANIQDKWASHIAKGQKSLGLLRRHKDVGIQVCHVRLFPRKKQTVASPLHRLREGEILIHSQACSPVTGWSPHGRNSSDALVTHDKVIISIYQCKWYVIKVVFMVSPHTTTHLSLHCRHPEIFSQGTHQEQSRGSKTPPGSFDGSEIKNSHEWHHGPVLPESTC